MKCATRAIPRTLVMGVLLSILAACGQTDTVNKPIPAASSSIASVAAPLAVATSDSTAAAEVPVASTGEQVSETETVAEEEPKTTQTLGLRISEMAPEPASQWKEGTHYTRLIPTQPTNAGPGQIEVTEVFWYGCPHCYALDSYLENWKKNGKAGYVNFVRVPVMWAAVHRAHARVFYTAEGLGKLDELHTQIFQAIHRDHHPLTTPEDIEQFFVSHGVAAADFQKSFSSFAVESSLKRAELLGLRYKVDSVPLIVINGKYVTDVGRAGGPPQLLSLINELASREHGT